MPSFLRATLPYPKVVAIDNIEKELNDIRDGLLSAGVPCIPLLYDGTEGLKKPTGLDTTHARYVFMDLNLNEEDVHHPPRLVDPICDALNSLAISGPYLLIFWTSHPGIVENVMALVRSRRTDVSLPFNFATMDKTLLQLPEEQEQRADKLAVLVTELSSKLSVNKVFSALLAWENKVGEAASNAIKTLHDTVRAPQPTGIAQKEDDFSKLLKYIASSAWGKTAANDDWGGSVASGLSPFMSDNLDYGISSDDKYKSIWLGALQNDLASKRPSKVSKYTLNTSCIIDTACLKKEAHGIWLQFKLTCSPEFVSALGGSGESLMAEFINLSSEAATGLELAKQVKLGMLDITRACDYSNRKHCLRRFVLGAIIPVSLRSHIDFPDSKPPSKKHDAIYQLPEVTIDTGNGLQDSIIQINFKYVLSLPDNSPLLKEGSVSPLCRVRRQALVEIISKFGSHTTSPGLLSFH